MSQFDPSLRPVLVVLAVSMLPHVVRLPLWITIWCLGAWAYIWIGIYSGWPRPGRKMRHIFLLLLFISVYVTFHGRFYNDTWVGLLAGVMVMKCLESRSYRDKMVLLFLVYFMVITNLFYDDALTMSLYMAVSVFLTTAVLIHQHHAFGSLKSKLRLAGIIMMQALPLTAMFFVLFPRVQGNFLGLTRRNVGKSGFSDSISPGSVSGMVRNNEIAFRVQFDGPVPPPELRYWRGVVFVFFDGRTWRKGLPQPLQNSDMRGKNPINYTITLEPHEKRWLFGLDMPISIQNNGVLLNDHTLFSKNLITDRTFYKVRSFLSYNTGLLQPIDKLTLHLPGFGSPKARELAQKWAKQLYDPEKIVSAALDYFHDNEFFYTLQPPPLGANPVDDFLFNTKKGYCEYYASAFVFLMRAAGIPARVVGGYLGGEINPYGDYLIVRQSHAHAWAEVWLAGKGWSRVDPTSAVAPNRVQQGVEAALSPEDQSVIGGRILLKYFRKIRLSWDVVNTYWNLWVMGYTFQDQSLLLSKLGISTDSWKWPLQAVGIAVIFTFLLTLIFAFRIYSKLKPQLDPVRRIYDKFCRKLAKINIERESAKGPKDYALQIISTRPDLKDSVNEIIQLYILLRYSPDSKADYIKTFKSKVKRFRPSKIPEKKKTK